MAYSVLACWRMLGIAVYIILIPLVGKERSWKVNEMKEKQDEDDRIMVHSVSRIREPRLF